MEKGSNARGCDKIVRLVLHKKEGQEVCKNFRGTTLLNIDYNIFTSIIQKKWRNNTITVPIFREGLWQQNKFELLFIYFQSLIWETVTKPAHNAQERIAMTAKTQKKITTAAHRLRTS